MRCGDAIAIVRFSFSRTLYMYTDTDTDTYTHIHRQTEAEANEKHSHIEPCVSSETNVTERYLLWPNEWIESERDIDARRTQNECWHLHYTCIGIVFVTRRSSISHTLFRRIWRHTLSLWVYLSFSLIPISADTCWEACFFLCFGHFFVFSAQNVRLTREPKPMSWNVNETKRCVVYTFFFIQTSRAPFLSSVVNIVLKYWLFTS